MSPRVSWFPALVLTGLCAASAAVTATPSFGQEPRYRPTNEQCFAGYADNTVFLHACPTETTYYCPHAGQYGWDTMCVPLSDAQLAQQRQEKAQQLEQQRLAKQKADERQRMIDEQVAKLGPGRRAEAEKFVDMKLAAEAARPKPKGPKPKEMCTQAAYTVPRSWWAEDMRVINKEYAELKVCAGGSKSPLACRNQSTMFGVTLANCDIKISCPAKQVECGSKVSAQ